MKKIINKIKSLGISGFTLIELLGVLVIMGILIIVVMPNLYRLINKNNNKDFDTYYDLVEFGANKYADDARSTLGSTNDVGCTKITLDDLIKKEYVSTFTKKDYTCTTGSNGVVIRNNNGKITVNFNLSCKKNGSEVYNKGTDDSDACVAYKSEVKESFKETVAAALASSIEEVDNISYIKGSTPNNYVRFSGQLFRIVSFNNTLNTVKIVSADPVASIRYNGTSSSSYTNSDMELWLNNEYLSALQKDYKDYLISSSWKSSASITRKGIVGLINKEEYTKIKDWYKTSYSSWLLDEGTSGNAYVTNNSNPSSVPANSYSAVRPAITLNADVVQISGNGSSSNPYVVSYTPEVVNDTTYLNTRIPGEYVKFSGQTYRIISTSSYGTKIIGLAPLPVRQFSAEFGEGALNYLFDGSTLGIYLNNDWLSAQSEKSKVIRGSYCLDTINGEVTSRITATCIDNSLVKSLYVGIPKLGELFTGPKASDYWTLNPNDVKFNGGTYTESSINIVKSLDASVEGANIKNTNAVYVVLNLSPDVQIHSGTGTTEATAFTLK